VGRHIPTYTHIHTYRASLSDLRLSLEDARQFVDRVYVKVGLMGIIFRGESGCVCVCVCVRARERGGGEGDSESGKSVSEEEGE
jgi:hypothetical protein